MLEQVEQALRRSATRILTGLVELLPGVLALLIAVLLAAFLGWLLALLLRRVLRGIDFDQRLAEWGWSDLPPWWAGRSPTKLLVAVTRWAVIVLGFVIGLAAFDPTLTSSVVTRLFGSVIDLLAAAILLIAGTIFARFLSRGVLISLVNLNIEHARLVSLGVRWLLLVFSAAMALNQLGIGGRIVDLAFGILFGGIVLALSLAVGLKRKDLAAWSGGQPPVTPPHVADDPLRHV
ncbi:MAG: hypothetical protein ACRD1H_14125 [Vicinamibacterales bacterium]